jgi:hypothetical protein
MLCIGTSAHALIALGDITGDPPFQSISILSPGALFTETVTFSLSELSAVAAVATGFTIDDFAFTSSYGGVGTTVGGPGIDTTTFLDVLAPGDYSFTLTGFTSTTGGIHTISLGAVVVPEPAEWLLFASGLAVVALIARRRRIG